MKRRIHPYRLAVLSILTALVAGCSKSASPSVPVAAFVPPTPTLSPAKHDDSALMAVRKDNDKLRAEVAELRSKLAQATKNLEAWKVWAEKQAQASDPVAPSEPALPELHAVKRLLLGKLEVGQQGPFESDITFCVTKVLSKDEVLLTPEFFITTVRQVGNGQTVSTPVLRSGLPFVLKGWTTERHTDKQRFPLKGSFAVIGTKKLADGRTLFLISPSR